MKIAIVIRKPRFNEGGGGTFVKSIVNECISRGTGKYDYIFCYKGSVKEKTVSVIDGITYINMTSFASKHYLSLLHTRASGGLKNLRQSIFLKKKIQNEVSMWDLLAEKANIDLFWFTFPYDPVMCHPYILTIWDLGHRTDAFYPEVSMPLWNWNTREFVYQTSVYRATYILTGNETGKKEILENYPVKPEKIKVVPFPISDFCYGKEKKPDKDIPDEFYFYPAQFWAHKNHKCIIDSLSILKNQYNKTVSVVFTGSDKGNLEYIKAEAKLLGIEKQIYFLGYVSNEEIKYLYTHAKAMVYASLMGPNNLPPLEAAYLGCPVIITDIVGHKEQMGENALYFNGLDAESLADVVFKFESDAELSEDIKNKAAAMMKEYNKQSYTDRVFKLIDEFAVIRARWGKNY